MNCETSRTQLGALLDGELSPNESAALRRHLADCPACVRELEDLRALDGLLSSRLPVPNLKRLIARVESRLPPRSVFQPVHPRSTTHHSWASLLLAGAILLAVTASLRTGVPAPSLAETSGGTRLVRATGAVEVLGPGGTRWTSLKSTEPVVLADGARVRTVGGALCELQTGCSGVLRMNQATELIVHPLERVELVQGQLWAQAAEQCELGIQLAPLRTPTNALSVFLCPSSSETQWSVRDDRMSCTPFSEKELAVATGAETYPVAPGTAMTIVNGRPEETGGRTDPLAATQWQLPLLAMKDPGDGELQSRLDALLAVIGETKASYLYESDILKLGPAGAVPLIAYVQSERSRAVPSRRHRAMGLVSRMADQGQRGALRELVPDADPVVARSAQETLSRLDGEFGPRDPSTINPRTKARN